MWQAEFIPDGHDLFMRVHRQWTKNGIPMPGAFQNRDGGMSTDWSQYSTAEQTRSRGRTPADNGVVKISVGSVRGLPSQRVEHTPELNNRAHTDVFGEKDEEVRLKFVRICSWVINPPSNPSRRISK
jgi:hypothetical protein